MSADLVLISCANKGCHTLFAIPDAVNDRLRETGESFCCPFGHAQSYRDSKAGQIERLQKQVKAERETRAAVEEEADRLRRKVKALQKKGNAGTAQKAAKK